MLTNTPESVYLKPSGNTRPASHRTVALSEFARRWVLIPDMNQFAGQNARQSIKSCPFIRYDLVRSYLLRFSKSFNR